MTRVTLDLDDSVLEELRQRAARDGMSLAVLVSQLLAGALGIPRQTSVTEFLWHTGSLGQPLIDLEDEEAVSRVLDRP
jgi:hypothetical protein